MDGAGTQIIQICGGECMVSGNEADLFYTVLGSCIAACVYDPVARVGGMNHYMLPHGKGDKRDLRYGDVALPRLIEQLCQAGAARHRLRAKLYGGARTLACEADIGEMNIALAEEFLLENNIDLTDTDLGGRTARWIKFHPVTGRSFIRTTHGRPSRFQAIGRTIAAVV